MKNGLKGDEWPNFEFYPCLQSSSISDTVIEKLKVGGRLCRDTWICLQEKGFTSVNELEGFDEVDLRLALVNALAFSLE